MVCLFEFHLFLIVLLYHQQGTVEDFDANTDTFVKETDVAYLSSQIKNCSVKHETEGLNVDCSKLGFITVPLLPQNTIIVDLSQNSIVAVNSFAFMNNTHLTELDLSYNDLTNISQYAFKGLRKLTRLSIAQSNVINLTATQLDITIADLVSLNNLTVTFVYNMHGKHNDTYDDAYANVTSIKRLNRIETLIIDLSMLCNRLEGKLLFEESWAVKYLTLYYRLGQHHCSGFEYKMKELISLTFISHIYYQPEKFLLNRIWRKFLLFSESPPKYLVPFREQHTLIEISQSANRLIKLKKLSFSGFLSKNTTLVDIVSVLNETKTLNVLKVDEHYICLCRGNNDYVSLPSSIRTLSLQSSCMEPQDVYALVMLNPGLDTLDVSFADQGCTSNSHICARDLIERLEKYSSNIKVLTYTNYARSFILDALFYNYSYQNLTRIDLSYNILVTDRDFFHCCPNIEYLDFSHCRLIKNTLSALRKLTKIKYLFLSNNCIGALCYADRGLENAPMNNDNFVHMKYLQVLDLSYNKIVSFLPSLRDLNNLQLLNLSGNMIRNLSVQNMKDLDQIADKTANITIDLSRQTLWCTCEALHFLEWMHTTKVRIAFKDSLTCEYPKGTLITDTLIQHLKKSCSSNATYVMISGIGVTLCLFLIAVALAYRYKWRLRYLFYMAKLNMKVFRKPHDYDRIYNYDAFISYSSEDFELARTSTIENLEVKKGLKLCLHERDFIPGDSIAFNISTGIHDSKKTLLFMSKAFFASEWCKYEMNIAMMETLYQQRDVILAIMLEKVPQKDIDIKTMDLINTVTYLEYPQDNSQDSIEKFWNKCYDFIVTN